MTPPASWSGLKCCPILCIRAVSRPMWFCPNSTPLQTPTLRGMPCRGGTLLRTITSASGASDAAVDPVEVRGELPGAEVGDLVQDATVGRVPRQVGEEPVLPCRPGQHVLRPVVED